MSRRPRIVLGLICLAAVGAASTVATARVHRARLPPPPPLPTALSVDEREWSVSPSRRVVAAGQVRMRVYNRGMDDHDLVVVDSDGVTQRVDVAPGEAGTIVARLEPGTYRVYCSLFAGTPESHELQGMWSTITVKRDPASVPARRASARAAKSRRVRERAATRH